MSVTGPIRVGVVLLSAVALLLTSCSEDRPKAQAPATSQTATTPKPSGSPSPKELTPPALPAAAREDTKRGAKAFARHYLDLINYAAATGDVAPLQAASSSCSGCQEYVSLYERTYADGGFFKDSGMVATTYFVTRQAATYQVLMTVHIPRTRFKLSESQRVRTGRSAEVSLRLAVDQRASENVVTSLDGVST